MKRILVIGVVFFAILSLVSKSLSPSETKTFPPMTDGLRLAVIGDFGQPGRPERSVANMVKSWNVDAVVTVGDNIYPRGQQQDYEKAVYHYYSWMIDRGYFFPALGNHDWGYPWEESFKSNEIPLLLSLPYLPDNGRYYSVTLGENLVQIFIIDSDVREPDGRTTDSVQGQWLKSQIAMSTATYKLVFLHEPPYSSCLFGDVKEMQWPFQEWGADAVFVGHCHFYERIMKGNFPYFVNGLGGGREVTPFKTITEGSTVRFIGDYGAQMIEATSDNLIISFITVNGKIIDRFVIPSP